MPAATRRSPFPGMDPWLEQHWGGVHHKLIDDLADQLAAVLPGDLYVEVEEDLYVVADEDWGSRHTIIRPGVSVTRGADGIAACVEADGGVAIAEPIRIHLSAEPVTIAHLEIHTVDDGNPLVTAIEVFSPTNKRDARARADYVRKRQSYYAAAVTLIEVDLLRGGRPLVDVPLEYIDPVELGTYACGVRRGGQVGGIEVDYYPMSLRARLPRLRVPLRPGDADAVIDLQPPIDHAYARGRYGTRIDYGRPPDPPLSADDAAWAADRVAAARV